MQLIIGVLLALALFWGIRQWHQAAEGAGWLQGSVISLIGTALLIMLVMGRVQMVVVLGVAAAVFWRPLTRMLRQLSRSRGGDAVRTVETDLLHMQFDRATGRIEGWLMEEGRPGVSLNRLDEAALRELYERARRHHSESVALLDAYLEQRLGERWRSATGAEAMTLAEACAILGVSADAPREAIISAHRRLIQKLHPDRGGSDYLAARVNEAKAVLLERFARQA